MTNGEKIAKKLVTIAGELVEPSGARQAGTINLARRFNDTVTLLNKAAMAISDVQEAVEDSPVLDAQDLEGAEAVEEMIEKALRLLRKLGRDIR